MSATERGVAVLSMAEIVAKSPDPVAAINSLGASIARSQMLGPTDRQEIGVVVVLICLNTGMTLADLFRTHQISFGRLEKRIDAAVAEFRSKGGRIEWLADGGDGRKASARFTLSDESIEAGCSVEEAVKAGWTKNKKWETEPATMLRARVKKRGIVALCPEIFFGEDAEDRDITPLTVSPEQMAASAASAAAKAPAPARPSPAPAPTPAAAPAPAPTAPTAPAPSAPATSGPKLSDEIQSQLVEIIGAERIAIATEWAASVNWLAAGQTLEDLSEKNAKYIVANAQKFLTKLAEFEAKKGGVK